MVTVAHDVCIVLQALLCGEYVVPGVEGDRPVIRCGATREYVTPQDLTEAGVGLVK